MSRWALLLLAGLAIQSVRADEGVDQAQSTVATPRYRADLHTQLGATYYSRGQLGVALQELNDALLADSSYAPAYNVRGLVYMALREDDQARKNFERALSLNPADSDTHNNYGWFLCQRGQAKESIVHFLAALKDPLYPTPEKAYFNAGVCSLKFDDNQNAESYFLKAVQLQAQLPQAYFYLAELYFKRSAYSQASNALIRYMQQTAFPSAESLWLGVRIEHKTGNRTAEVDYSFQLRKRYPDSREAKSLAEGLFE